LIHHVGENRIPSRSAGSNSPRRTAGGGYRDDEAKKQSPSSPRRSVLKSASPRHGRRRKAGMKHDVSHERDNSTEITHGRHTPKHASESPRARARSGGAPAHNTFRCRNLE
jgi:hypothetical protein